MTERDEFLRRIARSLPKRAETVALPSLDGVGSTSADAVGDFKASLSAAAGKVLELSAYGSLEEALSTLSCYRSARKVCSALPGISRHNIDLETFEDPRSLAQVHVAVLQAKLGVAENGAVWLVPNNTLWRALLFLSEHVVALLDRTRIVDNMHRAYEKLDVSSASFGCFVSGPSKTADIEQALVIGAHGPRSFTVILT